MGLTSFGSAPRWKRSEKHPCEWGHGAASLGFLPPPGPCVGSRGAAVSAGGTLSSAVAPGVGTRQPWDVRASARGQALPALELTLPQGDPTSAGRSSALGSEAAGRELAARLGCDAETLGVGSARGPALRARDP